MVHIVSIQRIRCLLKVSLIFLCSVLDVLSCSFYIYVHDSFQVSFCVWFEVKGRDSFSSTWISNCSSATLLKRLSFSSVEPPWRLHWKSPDLRVCWATPASLLCPILALGPHGPVPVALYKVVGQHLPHAVISASQAWRQGTVLEFLPLGLKRGPLVVFPGHLHGH